MVETNRDNDDDDAHQASLRSLVSSHSAVNSDVNRAENSDVNRAENCKRSALACLVGEDSGV